MVLSRLVLIAETARATEPSATSTGYNDGRGATKRLPNEDTISDMRRIKVTEVHNFGGFFGGDTVTLSAMPWPDGEEETLTIDDRALANIPDRYLVAAGMLLDLQMQGERVDRAFLIAAPDAEAVRSVLTAAPPMAHDHPEIRAYLCPTCGLWLLGAPIERDGEQHCAICTKPIS